MVTLRERHDPLRLMGRRLLLAFLAALVLGASWALWSVWGKERESAQLKHDAQAQLADLEKRQTQLERDYAELQTSRGMEAAVRDQYAMGEKGEGMIVIVEPPAPKPVEATSSLAQWFRDVLSHL